MWLLYEQYLENFGNFFKNWTNVHFHSFRNAKTNVKQI